MVLPHIVDVTLSFIPIGTQNKDKNLLPQKGANQSNIAQNYNGNINTEPNYIDGNKIPNPKFINNTFKLTPDNI